MALFGKILLLHEATFLDVAKPCGYVYIYIYI